MNPVELIKRLRAGARHGEVEIAVLNAAVRELGSRVDLADMQTEFEKLYQVKTSGSTMALRPVRQGSYRPAKTHVSKFVKRYLVERGRSDAFSQDLVDRFRAFLLADAEPLKDGELLTSNPQLVD